MFRPGEEGWAGLALEPPVTPTAGFRGLSILGVWIDGRDVLGPPTAGFRGLSIAGIWIEGRDPLIQGDTYFEKLGSLGYTGSLIERQYKYLRDQGYDCESIHRMREHLRALGYSGTTTEMVKQKTLAEGFKCSSEMFNKTGLIPL